MQDLVIAVVKQYVQYSTPQSGLTHSTGLFTISKFFNGSELTFTKTTQKVLIKFILFRLD